MRHIFAAVNYSIVIIARNESKTLPRLINSIAPFMAAGGKVFLTDTGSTDDTVEVAKKLGCIVTEKKFDIFLTKEEAEIIPSASEGDRVFDFSAARNWASEQADTDWVHVMPCDEEWSTYEYGLIDSCINEELYGMYCRINYHLHEGIPTVTLRHNTIYNKKKMVWEGMVHELLVSRDHTEPTFRDLPIVSNHYKNMETDRSHYLTGLAYDCLIRKNSNLRNEFYLGRELVYNYLYSEAIQFLKNVGENETYVHQKSEAYILKGICYMQMGEADLAIRDWATAVTIDPRRREPAMRLSNYYYQSGDAHRSLFWASAALTIKGLPDYIVDTACYGAQPYKIIYWAAWQLGDIALSTEAFKKAYELDPNDPQIQIEKEFYL
jgi:glycosyltransferase involved in cell wall biosynthesis